MFDMACIWLVVWKFGTHTRSHIPGGGGKQYIRRVLVLENGFFLNVPIPADDARSIRRFLQKDDPHVYTHSYSCMNSPIDTFADQPPPPLHVYFGRKRDCVQSQIHGVCAGV